MGYFYIFITILMALGSWWAGSKAWEEFSTGDFSGVIKLEDGSSPKQVKIAARFKGVLVKEAIPEENGIYQLSVKTGAYSVSFRAEGFKTAELPISIQSGMTPVAPILLEAIPKSLEISITDKQNRSYSNVEMQLVKIGQLGSMSQFVTELRFNRDGVAKTPSIGFGNYGLVLIAPITDDRKFLWVNGESQDSYPGFRFMANVSTYKIVLPKVLHSEKSGPNSAPTYTPVNDFFYAQTFHIDNDLNICGIGFGIGIGGNGVPSTLQIRTGTSQEPSSNVLVEVYPNKFSASLSDTRSGSFGSYCDEKQNSTKIKTGTYWIVAKYNALPEKISLLGGPDTSSGKSSMKKSTDGKIWTDFSYENIKMLDFFLTE